MVIASTLTCPLACGRPLRRYAALTITGAIFSQYGLVVSPINYPLTMVNILLFLSSAWHLGRKIKADFL